MGGGRLVGWFGGLEGLLGWEFSEKEEEKGRNSSVLLWKFYVCIVRGVQEG